MKSFLLCASLLHVAAATARAQAQPTFASSADARAPLRPAPQERPYMRPRYVTLTAAAGVSQWDLSGTGTSVLLAVRADRPLGPLWLLGEGSLSTFRTDEQAGASYSYIVPEVQLQFQVPRAIAPYVGVGAGAFRRLGGDAANVDRSVLTTSAAAGVRLWGVVPRAVLRGELRIRGVGQHFTGSAAEWTGGVGWSF